MSDLIDRQTAMKMAKTYGAEEYDRGYENGKKAAQPGWIPVTERLPENDNDVLVTDGTDCAVAYWRTDAQAWDDSMHGWCDLYGLDVIAWQPLPIPYQEGGQDESDD